MRLSLAPREGDIQRVCGSGQPGTATVEPSPQRSPVVAAAETVRLVLGEDSPLPASATDVDDLTRLLRCHIAQLGTRTARKNPAVLRARRLCSDSVPEGHLPNRIFLVRLAEATQELIAQVERGGPEPMRPERRRCWKPPINVRRGVVVFAVALALALTCLIFAASVPWT